jgi:hypothetical protein
MVNRVAQELVSLNIVSHCFWPLISSYLFFCPSHYSVKYGRINETAKQKFESLQKYILTNSNKSLHSSYKGYRFVSQSSKHMENTAKPVVKRIAIFNKSMEFTAFVNRLDIEIIQLDVKGVEQSFSFQEGFMAVVFYKEIVPDMSQEGQNRFDLKEMAHYYGGWSELRKVIDELEQNDNEAAYDRAYSKD